MHDYAAYQRQLRSLATAARYLDNKHGQRHQDAWSAYRLPGDILITSDGTLVQAAGSGSAAGEVATVQAEVETARQRIATSAGVSPAAIRITIDFGV